jgi:hypothetical protein
MTYKDFTLEQLLHDFALTESYSKIFSASTPIEPTRFLLDYFAETEGLALRSEKARSEMIVLPILLELRRRNAHSFNIYSGERLTVDPERGLTGECDFILAKNRHTFTIRAPLFCLLEAKKNDIEIGLPQCAAQMLGAREYNLRHNEHTSVVHGCVTTGSEWQFLMLRDNCLTIDTDLYTLQNLEILLGILQSIIDANSD